MAFDPSTAKPVGGFDISSATPMGGEPEPSVLEGLSYRDQALKELAEDIGGMEALMIGLGRGFTTIGRGLGIAEPETDIERASIEALKEERPYTTGAGEILGEALPFVPAGMGIGAIPSLTGRIAAGGALGAAEGGLIAEGLGRDAEEGAMVGGAIGAGTEALFPVIGRLARSVYRSVKGKLPEGALIDAAGKPTQEMAEALQEAGLSIDDLTQDAMQFVQAQKAGAVPAQVARATTFAQEGVPLTKGELTQEFGQQAVEQRILESTMEKTAEPLRQFKLKQSNAVRDALEKSVDTSKIPEETGEAIKSALSERKKLLRTQKNELYSIAAENAKDAGGIPIFTGSLSEAVPDVDTIEDLAITSPQAMNSLDQLLVRYGLKDPSREMIEAGFEPKQLALDNFERFRKSLNAIERGDPTGASSVAIGPIKQALDEEVDNLAETLVEKGFKGNVVSPLKKAREITRELKTEFSPQSIAGQLVDVKRDGVTPITEASKTYSKLSSKSQPVENVRRVVSSLRKAGKEGQQGLADLQATTVMDLIESGFGTASRKIDGVPVFNPIAFNKRLNALGKDKLAAIFADNKPMLGRLNNIERIAKDLTPPSGTMPKGSASVILDALNKMGVMSIAGKVPGGGLLIEQVQQIAEAGANRKAVEQALNASPQMRELGRVIENELPGIASALGIAGYIEATNQNQ